jgi:Fe-Mn family superoxide dismutase
VWEPVGKKLRDADLRPPVEPGAGRHSAVLDAWEHAFYLQYENRKDEYFEAIWNVWNWSDVAERFQAARQINVELVGAGARVE